MASRQHFVAIIAHLQDARVYATTSVPCITAKVGVAKRQNQPHIESVAIPVIGGISSSRVLITGYNSAIAKPNKYHSNANATKLQFAVSVDVPGLSQADRSGT